jgi:hypothetical protein
LRKEAEAKKSNYQQDVDIRLIPSDRRRLIPRKVDKYKSANTSKTSKNIYSHPYATWVVGRWRLSLWDDEDRGDTKEQACHAHDPERPWPPHKLSEQRLEESANNESTRSHSPKSTEHHRFPHTRLICRSKNRDSIRQQKGRANTLKSSATVE